MSDIPELSHVSREGSVRMVDVGDKQATERTARAEAVVQLGVEITGRLKQTGSIEKGGVLETARIAGIMAAKQTSNLIPLCHQIPLSVVEIHATLGADTVRLESFVRCHHTTGVEMEAMTAVSVAALTVYDMCKAASKGITIECIRLLEKTGGKSGTWSVNGEANPE
ncbi:MAG: cyclic pyranopterin monophosphate synthase MoaC [Planctomycetes bacterium]|nr:cyclic pyranopterin monophosphate synthase MoaC [Planctomycetota bacterium]